MQGTIKIILPVLFYYSHLIMFTYGSKLPFSAHLQKLLTAGVLHYMIDVKTLSFELLVYFTPSVAFIQCIFQKAFSLSQSSKFGECESGALLFALCLRLVVLILQAIIHFQIRPILQTASLLGYLIPNGLIQFYIIDRKIIRTFVSVTLKKRMIDIQLRIENSLSADITRSILYLLLAETLASLGSARAYFHFSALHFDFV